MRREKLIACDILRGEIDSLLRQRPAPHLSIAWMETGLHDEPPRLREALREEIGKTRGEGYDAVLLAYGLCSNGTEGLTAADAPLIIPRAHDCITLFLGGRERYAGEHEAEPGTYWFSRGFLRRDELAGLGAAAVGPDGEREPAPFTAGNREAVHRHFVEEYGEENAAYLMEAWVDAWKANYRRAVLLTWDYPELEADRERVRAFAREAGWRYEERPADLCLVHSLLHGPRPPEAFLHVPPGETIRAGHDADVLRCGRRRD